VIERQQWNRRRDSAKNTVNENSMDLLSLTGILIGLGAIIGGNFLEGGQLASLANGAAFVIVMGGTTGAMLLQTPMGVFLHALRTTNRVLWPPKHDLPAVIEKIVGWSYTARREGLLGLEDLALRESDPFSGKGLQLLVDGNESNTIRSALELEMHAKQQLDLQAAKVYEAMGGYAPTIGILGAVMGLIHVMQNLTDPSRLGSGIATAFVATIYGVGLANLVFIPISFKLKSNAQAIYQAREMVLEGLIAISEGENPKNIEFKLQGYLSE
jgi:chemotaxis protein MotA